MRFAACAVAAAALLGGCSILGYRHLDDLKAEAKGRRDIELNQEATIVFRDAVRAIDSCHQAAGPARPFRRTVSKLDRETDSAVIDVLHDGRLIAHYEIQGTSAASSHVKAWWLPAVALCFPTY